jgi:hypothetical protein
VIRQDDIERIQDEIGRPALQAVRIDLDGSLEAADVVASPQAPVSGIDTGDPSVALAIAELAESMTPMRSPALLTGKTQQVCSSRSGTTRSPIWRTSGSGWPRAHRADVRGPERLVQALQTFAEEAGEEVAGGA